ncbi:MAG: carboxypeptidase M32 [Rectinema sp.]
MRKETERLVALDREHTLLAHIGAVLGWDQETYMPEKAVDERAEQLALIEGLAHDKAVSPEIGELLRKIEGAAEHGQTKPESTKLEPAEAAFLRVLRKEYDKETKLPADLVIEMARETSVSQAVWAKARAGNDFAAFAPHLEKVIALNRRMAACLNPAAKPYDVLLDLYEDGATEASIGKVFGAMRKELVEILGKIRSRPQVDDSFLHKPVETEKQEKISKLLMDALGYDRKRGRLDTTAHPFTTTLGGDDVRITTKYLVDYFPSSMFSTIHESGHALYELGIAPGPEFSGTRLADAASMAIHESQSRMWENMIGRSKGFWKRRYSTLVELAAPALDGVGIDAFMRGINRVEPSLIRTEADEVTYGLHVILRFEMESALISGSLAVKDVPEAWNAKMKELLGVDVPDDGHGCLQDIHWSMGSFGYFPSYALGNLYAAQFMDTMRREIPGLDAAVEEGRLDVPLAWLREKVHAPGATWLPGELVKKATGASLDPSHFTAYLRRKYGEVYGF